MADCPSPIAPSAKLLHQHTQHTRRSCSIWLSVCKNDCRKAVINNHLGRLRACNLLVRLPIVMPSLLCPICQSHPAPQDWVTPSATDVEVFGSTTCGHIGHLVCLVKSRQGTKNAKCCQCNAKTKIFRLFPQFSSLSSSSSPARVPEPSYRRPPQIVESDSSDVDDEENGPNDAQRLARDLRNNLSKCKEEVAQLKEERTTLQGECAQLRRNLTAEQARASELQTQSWQLKRRTDDLNRRLQEADTKIADLKKKYAGKDKSLIEAVRCVIYAAS